MNREDKTTLIKELFKGPLFLRNRLEAMGYKNEL
jgi:hypothetical protein